MRIGGSRTTHDIGAVAIVGITRQSPFLHGFRFDSSKTGPAEQPWTAYSAPSTVPQLSNQFDNMGDIAVSPENNKVVVGGYDNSNNINIYDLNIKSSPSFGSMVSYSPTDPEELDGVTGLAFSQDKTALAVSSDKYVTVYNWENGAISNRRWRWNKM